MRRVFAILALLFAPLAGSGATLLAVPDGERLVIRATANEITALDASSLRPLWTVAGVKMPHVLVLSRDGRWAAAIDSISNRLALVDLSQRTSRIVDVPETPLAAAFRDGALYVLSRDARRLSRVDPSDASMRSVEVPAASSHLLVTREGVLVYAALTGAAARLDLVTLSLLARRDLPRFGSDLEGEGGTGYLVEPRRGRLTTFSLDTLVLSEARPAGAVPIEIAVETAGGATRAATIAIADPSSKRVWRDQGKHSGESPFARGFLRGLLGLGLSASSSAAFPSGVDRLVVRGGRLLAFDTSTGTLYSVSGDRGIELASGLTWGSFALLGDALLIGRGESIERVELP